MANEDVGHLMCFPVLFVLLNLDPELSAVKLPSSRNSMASSVYAADKMLANTIIFTIILLKFAIFKSKNKFWTQWKKFLLF